MFWLRTDETPGANSQEPVSRASTLQYANSSNCSSFVWLAIVIVVESGSDTNVHACLHVPGTMRFVTGGLVVGIVDIGAVPNYTEL